MNKKYETCVCIGALHSPVFQGPDWTYEKKKNRTITELD